MNLLISILTATMSSAIFADSAEEWQLGFQDAATPIAEGIIELHHDIMFILFVVTGFVGWLLVRAVWRFNRKKNPEAFIFSHGTAIEIIWTIAPALILIVIAVPSFALLYSMDEVINPVITLKAIGHQWYWSYEYSDYNTKNNESLAFDSYMIPEEELALGQLRLLEVDNRVVVPAATHVRVIITASDVLHCWAVPSLGVKLDAVPGRLNQTTFFTKREGVFYGQCSELCGVNHAFMPIVVEAVPLEDYVSWVASKIELQEN